MYHEFLYQSGLFRLDDRYLRQLSVASLPDGRQVVSMRQIFTCLNHDLGRLKR